MITFLFLKGRTKLVYETGSLIKDVNTFKNRCYFIQHRLILSYLSYCKFETAVFWILEFVKAKPLNYLLSLRLLRSNKYLLFIWNLIIRMKRTIGITRNRIEALQKAKNGLNRKKNMYDALTQL